MSLSTALKQLQALSYSDMMLLATALSNRMKDYHEGGIDGRVVAEAIVHMTESPLAKGSDLGKQEDQILRTIFSRKRQMNIVNQKNGWLLEIPTIQGSQVVGTDLRTMFPMAIDQITTLHILSKP